MSESASESKEVLQTINPATGEPIKEYPLMSDEEAVQAIQRCYRAYEQWRQRPASERAEVIAAIADGLREREEELIGLMTEEMGKLKSQGEEEIELCTAICEWTAENGPARLENEERELADGDRGIITYSSLGVIYGIQPWNFPAYQVFRYAVANLMAGNGVLLKHAETVTGSALLLEEIFSEAGLPDHLFTVLRITHEQSDVIIEHELVRGVTLTGSPSSGEHIAEKAGANLKKTVLELGSNDAYIVLGDADLEEAVEMCVQGRIYNNGETCIAAKRFIVVDKVYEAFREAFVDRMKQIKTGDPTGDQADIGPMARKDLRDTLHDQVQQSVDKGAKILCGGELPEGKGFYYPATVLDNVKSGQPAYDDELFGPVASLIRAEDEADALRIANDSRFGLGGGIFTEDTDKAIELAANHFDTGMVFINGFGLAQPNMPFGGVKDSGYGREHGGFGVREFTNAKSIMVMSD